MIRLLQMLFFLGLFTTAYSQVKISSMSEVTGSPEGGWIPIVLNGNNLKINAGIFYNKLDSLYKKSGTDSVFSSTNGHKKFVFMAGAMAEDQVIYQLTITQLHALSPSSTVEGYVYYITDKNKEGFFSYQPGDATSIDDGAMVLVTTNGKRFRRTVQDNIINAAWFGAVGDGEGQNGISTLGLTFARAKEIFDHAESPVVLTQDDYDNQNINWFALQRAINYCLHSDQGNRKDGRLYIPAGKYTIQKGLLVAPVEGFVTSLVIEGAVSAYDGPRQTVITLDNKQSFALGLHRCKGVRIRNLFITGSNPLSGLSFEDVIQNEDPDIWINECSIKSKSPHAGIVVDPFFDLIGGNNPIGVPERYSDFLAHYTSTDITGGSTDIVFENCRLENFIVGMMFTPHYAPQNGDAMAFNNSFIKNCRSAIGIGQSQNRSILVNNLKVWGGVETVFDCARFGDGRADNVEVDGLDVAGGAKYLTRLSSYYNKGLIIDRMHAERLLSLGGTFDEQLAGALNISNSFLNFVGQVTDSAAQKTIYASDLIFQGGTLVGKNSVFVRYMADPTPLTIFSFNAVFDACSFNFLPVNTYTNPGYYVNYTTNKIVFRNCSTGQFNFSFGQGEFIKGGYAAELSSSRFLFLNNSEFHMTRYYVGGNQYKRVATESGNGLFQEYISFQQTDEISFSSVDTGMAKGAFQMSTTSEEFKRLNHGDYIFSYDVARHNTSGSSTWFLLGKIASIDESSGEVILNHLARNISTSHSYPVRVIRDKIMIPYFIVGDITQGSNLVTNVVQESNLVGYAPVGQTIQSTFFPVGTYIVSISGTTITLSNAANSSFEGADIIGADWKAIEYGTAPDTWPYICCYQAYKKGDVIYNSDPTNYSEVEKWTCIKSGITGSSKPPKFDVTFRSSTKLLTANGGINIGKDRFISSIIVNPEVMGSIDIGTTPGGNEVASSVALIGSTDNVVLINKYFRTETTLYFTGISASTEIIVLK